MIPFTVHLVPECVQRHDQAKIVGIHLDWQRNNHRCNICALLSALRIGCTVALDYCRRSVAFSPAGGVSAAQYNATAELTGTQTSSACYSLHRAWADKWPSKCSTCKHALRLSSRASDYDTRTLGRSRFGQTIRKDYGVVTMLCLLRQLWYIILLDLGYHPASHARDMDMGK
jgi:hypothetical protein